MPVTPVRAHRTRRPGASRLLLLLAAVLVVAATAVVVVRIVTESESDPGRPRAAGAATPTASASPTCRPTGTALRVVAASGIAPVVTAAAQAQCLAVTVTVDDSEAAASDLRKGTTDVWIPDSRVRGYLAVGPAVATAPSLATSPLVMVASPPVASALGRERSVSWGILLDQPKLAPLRVAIQDPATSGASLVLAGALAQVGTAATGGNQDTGVAAAAGALHTLGKVAGGTAGSPTSTQIQVVEQRLVPAGSGSTEIATTEGLPYLDYPFVTLPTGSAPAPSSGAAADLLAALRTPAAVAARDAARLLAPSATSAQVRPAGGALPLLPAVAVSAIPTAIAVANTSAAAASVLAVLDVSGSMADAAPGQQAPIEVVRQSAQTFFTTFGQGVDLGLWEFGYQLAPPSDHVEVFPIQPFASSQALLGPAIAAVQARQTGTALYATTLDAYRAVQRAWKPDRANLVAVFTDGREQDAPGSITLAALLAGLKAEADPARPVQVVFFGYGQADIGAMTAITAVTGGGVYPIASSGDIVGAFIRASGQIAVSAH